jgi:hypothetical protein
LGSFIFWTVVALMLTLNAYSQNTQQEIKELYEKHKNTIGFYRACGSPSNLENQQSDFTYYLKHLNNVKNLNLTWNDFYEVTEVNYIDYYKQFFSEDEMRIIYLDLAKRFRQLDKTIFQEDVSTSDYNKLDAINDTQTYGLIKNLMDSGYCSHV